MTDALVVAAEAAIVDGAARGATTVLAVDGEIVRVGSPADVTADARAAGARRLHWSGRALIPGTVNAHNHSVVDNRRLVRVDQPEIAARVRAITGDWGRA